MRDFKSSLYRFFFAPAYPYPLAFLRIGVAAVLIAQALSIVPVYFELYGSQGIMQGPVAKSVAPALPSLLESLSRWGMSESKALVILGCAYLFSLLGLLVGFQTRAMAFVATVTHFLFAQGHSTSYGVDTYAFVFLFYLIWIPSGEALSVDAFGKAPVAKNTTRLALRVVQIQLALSYFATGFGKALTDQWWNGKAIWYSLMLPVYRQSLPVEWLANVPWLAMALGWGTLVIEIGYAPFVFYPPTRKLWIFLVLSLHMGIGIFLGLHIFAAFMMVLTFSLFGVSPEGELSWRRKAILAKPQLA